MKKWNKITASTNLLAGCDGLNNCLPNHSQVGSRKSNRIVGIFYFLWLGQHGTNGPFDISKIIYENPEAIKDPNHPAWGGVLSDYHHWGKPLLDYYISDDDWILRKHVQLLTLADIDFLVLDVTNSVTYKYIYDKLFKVLYEIQAQGFSVPRIVFYSNTDSEQVVNFLYEDIYRLGRYESLWFYWDGKPLIIGYPDKCSDEIQSFFTFRLPQWPNEKDHPNSFPWIDWRRPQKCYYNTAGEKEVISVSVAQHPKVWFSEDALYGEEGNRGRSYHANSPSLTSDSYIYGYNFQEQWDYAISEAPKIIFITGWNEWIGMRFPGDENHPIRFLDTCTPEFSRDIEPMEGGYGDNYYMQLINNIRKWKGVPSFTPDNTLTTIHLDKCFEQWSTVQATYCDFSGDNLSRNHAGFGNTTLLSKGARNDVLILKVACDDANVYFYLRSAQDIELAYGENRLVLFINTGGNYQKGWYGYDFAINRIPAKTGLCIEKSCGGWSWEPVGIASFRVMGPQLQLAIPRHLFGKLCPLCLHFKWSDNSHTGDLLDFYKDGEVAPEGRLNYVYIFYK